jgi:hypothetical protein
MHATLLGLAVALLTALCQTATDIGTKVATREAEERLTLAVQWTVGAVLLSLLCLVWYPPYFFNPPQPSPRSPAQASGRYSCSMGYST